MAQIWVSEMVTIAVVTKVYKLAAMSGTKVVYRRVVCLVS